MDDHKGSDFNPNHFTPSQNRNWSPLLVQLRLFEATVCETVRKLIEKVEAIEKGNGKDGNGIVLEGKLELFGDMMKQMDKGISEQLVGIETDLNLAQSKLTDLELTVDRISRKLDKGDEPQSGTGRPNVTEIKVAAMKSKVVEIDGIVKENRERIIFLEQKVLDGNDDYFWNGHDNVDGENNFSLNQNDEEEQNQGLMGECEVMISDPFLLSGSHLSQYDGNPSISFSRWAQKFKDLLSLYTTQLTEEQKISRLRFCLSGPARAELDSMDLPPVTLDVTTALAGESESNIRKRLLEEFLDRLIPELQYEVKSERPTDYSRAYELSQHYELLQASRKSTSNVAMNELIKKVEALAMQNVRHAPNFSDQRDHRVCFYCKKAGHVIRNCAARKREANNGPNWRRDENSRRTERNGNYSRPFGQGYERNRETWETEIANKIVGQIRTTGGTKTQVGRKNSGCPSGKSLLFGNNRYFGIVLSDLNPCKFSKAAADDLFAGRSVEFMEIARGANLPHVATD
ncbi:hypothetical protein niasHT_022007 [Heterodera trifolii]|uniref:CCHC-type domain-containing protein n=1 Tax=Heterodera trifolii TaxID=157864 RepID=A0ABD2JNA8_9BILA